MKKYLIALCLSIHTLAFSDALVNHITIQWSTNGVDWNNNLSTDDDYSESFDSQAMPLLFVQNKIITDFGVTNGFRRFEVLTSYGSNLVHITNAMNIQTVQVKPIGSDGFTNLTYRVASYMTNETFHVADTNDYGFDTNSHPPHP